MKYGQDRRRARGIGRRAYAALIAAMILGVWLGALPAGAAAAAPGPGKGIVSLSAGGGHTLALREGGTVWAWGRNESGQAGDGSTATRSTPAQVAGLIGVIAVAAGDGHSVALKADGTVWAWGRNDNGQLGDGSTVNRSAPVRVVLADGNALTGVKALAAGGDHTIVMRANGTLMAWGDNQYGQLGDGSGQDQIHPAQVTVGGGALKGVKAVAAGDGHSLALKADGTVWAWGRNDHGQLGDGTTTNRSQPVQVSGLANIAAISAGADGDHALALRGDGTVWAWGSNPSGRVGDGSTTDRLVPVQVKRADGNALIGVKAVAAGRNHSLALVADGTVWAWGENGSGQAGSGDTTDQVNPQQVSGLAAVAAIAAGG